jgi:hypothetical protein
MDLTPFMDKTGQSEKYNVLMMDWSASNFQRAFGLMTCQPGHDHKEGVSKSSRTESYGNKQQQQQQQQTNKQQRTLIGMQHKELWQQNSLD